jgi:hypothetical protein
MHGGEYKYFNNLGQPTNIWTLDLNLINHRKFGIPLKFNVGKYVSSIPYIVNQHKNIIGFSGSIGN